MDPRRETEDRAPLDEEQIRADERARIERQRTTRDRGAHGDGRRAQHGRAPGATTPLAMTRTSQSTVTATVGHSSRPPPTVTARPAWSTASTTTGQSWWRPRIRSSSSIANDRDPDEEIEVVRTRSFSVGQLLTMLIGAALVVLGVFALIETGIDTPLDEPIEQVMGYDHTPLLGIIEVGAGALLILFALRPGGRWFVAVLGLALVLGGLLVLAEIDWTVDKLGAESSYAWIPIVAGLAVLLSSLLTPRRHQRMTGVPTQRVT